MSQAAPDGAKLVTGVIGECNLQTYMCIVVVRRVNIFTWVVRDS